MKNKRGITLISLVITIIILIIIAGVAIGLSLGENGLITKAQEAKELTNKQTAIEKIEMKITAMQINNYAEKQKTLTLKELSEILKNDNEIEYVTGESQKNGGKTEISDNPDKIYTKLKEYQYEFEINNSLQISRIDGKELSGNNNNNNSSKTDDVEESSIIEDIELLVSFNNGEYIELTCNAKAKNSTDIAGYIFLLNGEVKQLGTENVKVIDGLTLNTNYKVSAIVIDKYGKMKKTNDLEVKTENKVYLYKEGNECKYITNGWDFTGYHTNSNGNIEKNTDNMYIDAQFGSRIYCGILKTIDLSKYSGLYIEDEGDQYLCQISTIDYYNNTSAGDIGYASKEKIDISDYNSEYYIHITCANGGHAKIKNIWLEK